MSNIKKGQKVWVSVRNRIEETIVKSAGSKYITLEYDSRIKFDRDTLIEVNGFGSPSIIILDIEKHEKDNYYRKLVYKMESVKWENVTREDLDKIADILKEY